MSKFEEMCKTVADARKAWTEYRDRCFQHMASLAGGFVSYCEIPREHFHFLPVDKEPEDNTQYFLPGAIHLDSDGYWHVGWSITLLEAPNIFPYRRVLVRVGLTERDGKIMVKRGWDHESQELDIKDKSQCDDFYAGIVERVKEYFGRNPQDFAQDSPSKKTVGFKIP